MTAFETALIAAVRAGLGDPTADVYWRDGASAFRAETSYALSHVSRTRRGNDSRSLGTVTDGSAPETIRGNRATIVQVTVDANSMGAAEEAADALSAGIVGSAATEILWAANVSAARPGPIRSIPYLSAHGDTRSAAVFEIAINETRKVTVGTVPILAQAVVTGTVDPGDRPVGPITIDVP